MVAAAEHTVLSIRLALKHEDCDSLGQWVDDPVFGDPGLSTIERLYLGIMGRSVGADNFDHQIRAEPILVLIAWVVCILEDTDIWFTELPWPYLNAKWSKEDLPPSGAEQQEQHLIQEGEG